MISLLFCLTSVAMRDILTGAGWGDISNDDEFSAMVGITYSTLDKVLIQFGLQPTPLPSVNQSSTNSDSTPPSTKRMRYGTEAEVKSIGAGEDEGLVSQAAIDMLKRTQNGYKFSPNGDPVLNTTLTSRILLAMKESRFSISNFDTSGTTLMIEY